MLSEDEIAEVFPKSTHTIDIETFVAATDVPFVYLDRPYYLVPGKGGAKVYALLREALVKSSRIGLARVVLHTRRRKRVRHKSSGKSAFPQLATNPDRGKSICSFDLRGLRSKPAFSRPRLRPQRKCATAFCLPAATDVVSRPMNVQGCAIRTGPDNGL